MTKIVQYQKKEKLAISTLKADPPKGHPKKDKAHEVEGTPLNRAGRRAQKRAQR